MSKHKPPRAASTYRPARRNAVLRGEVRGVWGPDCYYGPTIRAVMQNSKRGRTPLPRLNRSRNRFGKHAYVSTYKEAREASHLYSDRPVR